MNSSAIFFSLIGGAAIALAVYLFGFDKTFMRRLKKKKIIVPKAKKKSAPMHGVCGFCGDQVQMPFRCKFCGGLYCQNHRLPENHDCDGV